MGHDSCENGWGMDGCGGRDGCGVDGGGGWNVCNAKGTWGNGGDMDGGGWDCWSKGGCGGCWSKTQGEDRGWDCWSKGKGDDCWSMENGGDGGWDGWSKGKGCYGDEDWGNDGGDIDESYNSSWSRGYAFRKGQLECDADYAKGGPKRKKQRGGLQNPNVQWLCNMHGARRAGPEHLAAFLQQNPKPDRVSRLNVQLV